MSRRFGHDPLLVQAAGGNISVKSDPHRMLIKASGVRLSDLNARAGWASGDPDALRRGLTRIRSIRSGRCREKAYASLLGRASKNPPWRVSMEAGFHVAIKERYVAHLHSVVGILLGMMPERRARTLVGSIWEEPLHVQFVPASIPGYELVRQMIPDTGFPHREQTHLWIQRNHGLVWSSRSRQALTKNVLRFEHKLRRFFGLSKYSPPHSPGSAGCRRHIPQTHRAGKMDEKDLCFCHWPRWSVTLSPLFPDFVIYFDRARGEGRDVEMIAPRLVRIRGASARQRRDKEEVFYVHALVSTIARNHGWLKALPGSVTRALKIMETERLRRQQIMKS